MSQYKSKNVQSETGLETLSAREICDYLRPAGCLATEDYITKPNQTTTQLMYACMLDATIHKPLEHMYDQKETLLSMLQNKVGFDKATS